MIKIDSEERTVTLPYKRVAWLTSCYPALEVLVLQEDIGLTSAIVVTPSGALAEVDVIYLGDKSYRRRIHEAQPSQAQDSDGSS